VFERLVENWLTSAGERGYELAFAQLLAAEDHLVLQGPVHHPFEHGKDILTIAPNGDLHAYQLKGPDLHRLEDFEKIQAQLFALAGTAATHPAISPARRPDRVFLVTSATLTPPVRDRIEKFNLANTASGWPAVEPIEREQLLTRFVAAHGKHLPQALPEIRTLLELYYSDAGAQFPVAVFARYLSGLLPFPPQPSSIPESRRAVASAALLTAYAAASWTRSENHLAVAQAWLTACACILHFAAARKLESKLWLASYGLAFEAVRTSLAALSKEAAEARDLIVPDLADGIVYPSRALLICGFLGAYLLSERTLGQVEPSTSDHVRTVLTREAPSIQVAGESGVPAFFITALAFGQLGEVQRSEGMMLSLVRSLSKANQRDSKEALADPYHDLEQVLLHQLGADSDLEGEEFDGRSYTLHVGVEWLARRLWRQHLALMWTNITRVEFVELQPSTPARYLACDDDDGEMKTWFAGQPQSWAALLAEARTHSPAALPDVLWEHREMIPYLPLLFAHRLTRDLARAIDVIATDPDYRP
jgi:hypothetical protein